MDRVHTHSRRAINTPTFLSNHKGGEYVFLVYRITDIGGGFSFQCMGNGRGKCFWCMENLVGGWGYNTKIYILMRGKVRGYS